MLEAEFRFSSKALLNTPLSPLPWKTKQPHSNYGEALAGRDSALGLLPCGCSSAFGHRGAHWSLNGKLTKRLPRKPSLVSLDLSLSNLRARSFSAATRPQKSPPLSQTDPNSCLSQYFNSTDVAMLIWKCNYEMNGFRLAVTSCFYLLIANLLSGARGVLVNRHGSQVRWLPIWLLGKIHENSLHFLLIHLLFDPSHWFN